MTAHSTPRPNEIFLSRILPAPVEKVWEAWVKSDQCDVWWGPRGIATTTVRKNVVTQGDWLYSMKNEDGTVYPNYTKYLEVVPNKKLVYDHGGFEGKPPMFRVAALFTDLGNETQLDFTMEFPSAELAANTKKFIKKANGDSTWDRLAEFLELKYGNSEVFIINRSFSVSRDKLFDFWTDSELLAKWMGPTGSKTQFIRASIQVGGESFYSMIHGEAHMFGKVNYLEITKPIRLVYTQFFVDKDEKISRHPFAPVWPEKLKTTVIFYPEGSTQSRVSLRWEPYGKVTADELAVFTSARNGMLLGWSGSFEQLDARLI